MIPAQFNGSHDSDAAGPQAHGLSSYDELRSVIAGDIAGLKSGGSTSAARLVTDLFEVIASAFERKATYGDIAKLFEARGVPTTSDAVRVAYRRECKRRGASKPASGYQRNQRTMPPSPAAVPPGKGSHARAAAPATDPKPTREPPPTRGDVARHLD